MALTITLPKGRKTKSAALPSKRSINLAQVDVKRVSIPGAVIGIVLILIAAGLFSKFLVADRLADMARAEGRAAALRHELQSNYDRLNELSGIEDDYAHYTVADMTQEELETCDRSEVVELIESTVLSGNMAQSWRVTGNQLTLQVKGGTLQEINLLARRLEQSPIVSFCTVNKAVKTTDTVVVTTGDAGETITEEYVTADIVAYLLNPEEAGE